MAQTEPVSEILQAKYRGNQARVEELLKNDPALNIFEAAATGQTARVRELLAANPSLLNAYAPDGFHPLGLAAFFGNTATVDALLQAGADVNQQSRESMKVSALHSAAAAGRPDIVEMLLAKGANPNVRAEGGVTVFHEAGVTGQIEIAEMLLTHGADVNATDNSGKTPLAHAINSKKDAMAAWLRAHGGR
ncbi:MAG TPA: ankyrin repeat domain-containing protein [Vicinamibacterales bacterium]|nr:ankyrin repeat domain-containing protein [Vicinamibacterales bacterium]